METAIKNNSVLAEVIAEFSSGCGEPASRPISARSTDRRTAVGHRRGQAGGRGLTAARRDHRVRRRLVCGPAAIRFCAKPPSEYVGKVRIVTVKPDDAVAQVLGETNQR